MKLDTHKRNNHAVKKHNILALLILVFLLVVVMGGGIQTLGQSAEIRKLPPPASVISSASKTIREGRDMIEQQNWGGAIKCFNSLIDAYPHDKNIDAAIYWLAFSLKKQGQLHQADRELVQLIEKFPISEWLDDARAMRIEIAGAVGNKIVIREALQDKDEEVRLIALQSIFEADASAGAIMAGDFFKMTNASSRLFKEAIVNMLGHYRSKESDSLLEKIMFDPAADIKLRGSAIFWIARMNTDHTADILIRLYDSLENESLKETLLLQLGRINRKDVLHKLYEVGKSDQSEHLRKIAINCLKQSLDPEAISLLKKIRN